MVTTRVVIRVHQRARVEPHCLGPKSYPGSTGKNARLFMEAVLWIARHSRIQSESQQTLAEWYVSSIPQVFEAVTPALR